ncbi:sodium:calcium antiporter [Candidatus Woesearchaeota archaeon]|nr:sodium:calcium antiporter [Candidatus Woesearchaeota archaeon]MBW3016231.1 sodium:calcium antiporter [Candidatus Woesearchaeota archaeon]
MVFIPAELAHPLLFNSIVLVASLYILFKSADLIVYGISNYAKKLGLSDALIGLVVVAMAASAPEIISSLTGFLAGHESVGFGAILGANMVHATLALGFLCLVGKKIELEPNIFTKRRLVMWAALMLPFVLALDGVLSRADGVILIAAFAAYLVALWRLEGTLGKIKKNVKIKNIWRDVVIFLGCFAALMLAGRWLVFSSVQIANYFNIPAFFIALTVIGVGTTIPDIAVEVRSLFRKHASIGLGDLLGALIIELLLFLGIVALIRPIFVNLAETAYSLVLLAVSISLVMYWMKNKYLTWKHGLVLACIYLVLLAIEIYKIW